MAATAKVIPLTPVPRRLRSQKVQELLRESTQIMAEMKNDLSTWVPHWRDITDYMLPWRGVYMTEGAVPNIGSKRHQHVVNGTAKRALRTLAAGMQGGLASPSRPWFVLTLRDKELAKYGPVKQWLHDVQTRLYALLNESNFYTEIHELYEELSGFGTGMMYVQPNGRMGVRFKSFTIGSYMLACDQFGIPDSILRMEWQTVRQLAQRFGMDALPQDIRLNMKDSPKTRLQYYQLNHLVMPNEDFSGAGLANIDMPYRSIWWIDGKTDQALRISGFEGFPGAAARWNTTGSHTYGNSPGMDVLADVKELQRCCQDLSIGRNKQVDPPMVTASGFQRMLQTFAGGHNEPPNPLSAQHGFRKLYDVQLNLEHAAAQRQDLIMEIREGLYNDLFLMLQDRNPKTATEVAEMHEEKLMMLGPVIERQFFELLDPVLGRTYSIAERQGLLPPMPDELDGMTLEIEYKSLLAQAQKLVGVDSIRSYVGFIGELAATQLNLQMPPTAWDNVDVDEIALAFHDSVGAPPKLQRTKDMIEKIRRQRAQQQAAAQAQQQEQEQLAKMQAMSQMDTSEGNALADLKQSMTGV